MRTDRQMPKILAFVAALVALPSVALAAGGETHVEKANNDIHNQASLQRGARNFVNYCLACHSARYVRYNRVAADIGLTEEQMVENLLFVRRVAALDHDQRPCTPTTPSSGSACAPPDLSLIARARERTTSTRS